jgi:hypothetical protein
LKRDQLSREGSVIRGGISYSGRDQLFGEGAVEWGGSRTGSGQPRGNYANVSQTTREPCKRIIKGVERGGDSRIVNSTPPPPPPL